MTATPEAAGARLLGAHMPTAGGLHKAIVNGDAIGCGVVQLFTSNPRQWSAPPPTEEAIGLFRQALEASSVRLVVSHDSYLINLAAPDAEVFERSFDAFVREIGRCAALGIPWVVTHMGCHLGKGEEAGLRTLCESVGRLLRETAGAPVGIALETTAGQGTCLGAALAHLAAVIDACGGDARLGVCLDTCHLFAAGYNLAHPECYEEALEELERLVGLDRVKLAHVNDARKPLGSRVDRHEHLGRGGIGMRAVARLACDPRLAHVPLVVETPQAETMHAVNVSRLRRVAAGGALGMCVTVRVDAEQDGCAEVDLPWGATVADLLGRMPGAGLQPPRCGTLTVNGEPAAMDAVLFEADQVDWEEPVDGERP